MEWPVEWIAFALLIVAGGFLGLAWIIDRRLPRLRGVPAACCVASAVSWIAAGVVLLDAALRM